MEVRVSRIVSEYFECTRKEAEEYLRAGRVKVNSTLAGIGDKAVIDDNVTLDEVMIPLKGIFRKVAKENAGKKFSEQYGKHSREDLRYMDNPKSKERRKGKKDFRKKRPSKFEEIDFL